MFKSFFQDTKKLIIIGCVLIVICVILFAINLGLLFPPEFEGKKIITIPEGSSAQGAAYILKNAGLIRNPSDFILLAKLTDKETKILSGIFSFDIPVSTLHILREITDTQASDIAKITIREGWNIEDIDAYFAKEEIFSKGKFMEKAASFEGFLFPDTYFLKPGITPEAFITLAYKNYQLKIKPFNNAIKQSSRTEKDIIIMASLLEKESANSEDRKIISGILWKRLQENRALQVDATISYIALKSGTKITQDDFTVDSPYNTYRYPGLPKGPIANPGIDAIDAALFPKETPYWFYLHDSYGTPHYASTFEEHKKNRLKYLP